LKILGIQPNSIEISILIPIFSLTNQHQVESLFSDETQEMVVDFTDFSDFYGTKPWPHINPHFDSIAAHCDICSFKYDYIIKVSIQFEFG